ncbi:MAG: hypothetical protein ACHQVS_01660 [Candidatus Babeliales bacterium]
MNRTTILFVLLSLIITIPAQAMHAKKKPRVSCLEHCAAISAVIVFSSMCTSVGFGMHREIVKQVRDERAPCLTVWGTNPEFGPFYIQPPLCDYRYNDTGLIRALNRQLGEGTILYSEITPCDTQESHDGPVKRVSRACIDNPAKITEKQLVKKKPKKQKSD